MKSLPSTSPIIHADKWYLKILTSQFVYVACPIFGQLTLWRMYIGYICRNHSSDHLHLEPNLALFFLHTNNVISIPFVAIIPSIFRFGLGTAIMWTNHNIGIVICQRSLRICRFCRRLDTMKINHVIRFWFMVIAILVWIVYPSLTSYLII